MIRLEPRLSISMSRETRTLCLPQSQICPNTSIMTVIDQCMVHKVFIARDFNPVLVILAPEIDILFNNYFSINYPA